MVEIAPKFVSSAEFQKQIKELETRSKKLPVITYDDKNLLLSVTGLNPVAKDYIRNSDHVIFIGKLEAQECQGYAIKFGPRGYIFGVNSNEKGELKTAKLIKTKEVVDEIVTDIKQNYFKYLFQALKEIDPTFKFSRKDIEIITNRLSETPVVVAKPIGNIADAQLFMTEIRLSPQSVDSPESSIYSKLEHEFSHAISYSKEAWATYFMKYYPRLIKYYAFGLSEPYMNDYLREGATDFLNLITACKTPKLKLNDVKPGYFIQTASIALLVSSEINGKPVVSLRNLLDMHLYGSNNLAENYNYLVNSKHGTKDVDYFHQAFPMDWSTGGWVVEYKEVAALLTLYYQLKSIGANTTKAEEKIKKLGLGELSELIDIKYGKELLSSETVAQDLLFARFNCQTEKAKEVIERLSKVIATRPNMQTALSLRMIANHTSKIWEGAIEDATSLLKLNPDNMNAYYYRGKAYQEKKDYKKAAIDLEKYLILTKEIDVEGVSILLGQIYLDSNETQKATKAFSIIIDSSKKVSLDPKLVASAYSCRADAYYILGDTKRALVDARDAYLILVLGQVDTNEIERCKKKYEEYEKEYKQKFGK